MKNKHYKKYHITFFPLEEKWMIFKNVTEIISPFLDTENECKQFIDNLIKKNKK